MDQAPGAPLATAEEDQAAAPTVRGPFGLPAGIGPLELVALGLALLVPLLALPNFDIPQWSTKLALLLPVVGPGLVILVGLARRGDRAALVGCLYLGWVLVSALCSFDPLTAVLGGYGQDRGALVLAGYLSCWAIGRRVHADALPLLVGVAAATIAGNVAMGVLQVVMGADLGRLSVADGRAAGFAASSVYLGGLVAGGMGMVAALVGRSQRRIVPWMVVLALFSGGANLTGSRISLLAGVLVAVAATLVVSPRRLVLVLFAVAVGVGLSVLVPQPASTVGRLGSEAGAGITPRIEMWQAGADALAERPILGWGPGRFRAATSPRISPEFVIGETQDKLFFDAHNLFVEQATTVGIVGVALLAGWIVLAGRSVRGPLAWLAVGTAVTWLLEPISISTAPLALLALGAAAPRLPAVAGGIAGRVGVGVTAVAGLAAAVALLIGTQQVRVAITDISVPALDRAEQFLPSDGVLDNLRYQLALQEAQDRPTEANKQLAIVAAYRTAEGDPERPQWWATVGWIELAWGDPEKAVVAFATANERNPWSEFALEGQRLAARTVDDEALARQANTKLCRIRSEKCEPR